MEYIPKREANKMKRKEKFLAIYADVSNEMSWPDLAKKYNYKNAHSMRATYYVYVVPFLKQLSASGE
jgi:hypothetical protein